MAGFEEQLNSILGNQEAMNQIMALARSLSGEQTPAPEQTGLAEGENYAPVAAETPPPDLSAMLGQLDPKMLRLGMEVMRQVQSTGDRNAALLNALRPFLREERQARLDRAIQIARMAKAVRVALGVLGGKEGELV
jgi:hypothetical protein